MRRPHNDDVGQETLGEALERTRGERGHTQKAAAKAMGTSQPNVQRWEAGVEPKGEHAEMLMEYLDVDFNVLGSLRLRTAVRQAQNRTRPR